MAVRFGIKRLTRGDEQILEATAPINVPITTTNKLLWVLEAYSSGRLMDPLPGH